MLKAARSLNLADALMAGNWPRWSHGCAVPADFARPQVFDDPYRCSRGWPCPGRWLRVCNALRPRGNHTGKFIGLVEAGVGLLPAGGGCKELALRAARNAINGDPFPLLKNYFQSLAAAQLSKSAEQAKELGYLRPADTIVMNRFELLYVAKAQALALAESGYRPPLKARDIPVAGATGIATLKGMLVNMREGNFISDHDYLVGSKIAHVRCGGDLTAGSLVDENWFLELERTHL